eukprot:3200624-Pyramimonas_sp.AAC.1
MENPHNYFEPSTPERAPRRRAGRQETPIGGPQTLQKRPPTGPRKAPPPPPRGLPRATNATRAEN